MSALTSRLPSDVARTGSDSARIRFRRSLTLLGMTLVLPGSAQLVAGNKRVGHVVVRVWIAVLAFAGVLFGLAFVRRSWLLNVLTNPTWLLLLRIALWALALVWVALFCDAWRLGDPLDLRRGHRLFTVGLNTSLCLVTGGALLFSAHLMAVQRDFILTVFGSGATSDPTAGRYNVLLLGGDSGVDRWGLRPDSITVASVDENTGKTVLFGLPRNLEKVPFPAGTAMNRRFPHGFKCSGCYLNGVFTWAIDHPDLFPGDHNPGITATEQAVEAITGLPINYYVMVNLQGFQDLVDAVGGVTINVPQPVPIGGIGGAITGHIPAGVHKLNGYQTLWFARSRVADDDYARMARQKCVMSAMLQQLSPQTVVTRAQKIADASKKLLSTDLPASELGTFIDLALKARSQPVATVSFVPPKIESYNPDYAKIAAMVTNAIARSKGDAAPAVGGHAKHHKHRGSKAANHTTNLASAC